MTTQYWLVKSEPDTYSWTDLVKERRTDWTGVRNYAARNHLKAMQRGDQVLFYESGSAKSIAGIAEVTRAAFPDATSPDEPGWVAIELKAVRALDRPVLLSEIRAEPKLANMILLRNSRLSVQPVTAEEFKLIEKLAKGG